MFNKLRSVTISRGILYLLLGTFTFTHSIPLNANDVDYNSLFSARIQNAQNVITALVESHKLKDLVEYIFILKSDIENHCNIKIDFEEYFQMIYEQMINQGVNISKKSLDVIKIRFLQYEKKILKGQPTACIGGDLIFDGFNAKVGNGHHNDCESEHMPTQIVFGVTVALVGLLFMFAPIGALAGPAVATSLEAWGAQMFATGSFIAAQKLCDENDERNYKPNPGLQYDYGLLPRK